MSEAETAPATVNEGLQVVDHAAAQSDRWLFVACLVIGLIFVYSLIRYFMKLHASLSAEISSVRDNHEKHLREDGARMVEVVAKNTSATEQNTRVLEAVQRKLGG